MEKSTNSRGWMREGFAGYSSCKLFPKGRKPKEDIKWRARVKMEVSERRFKNLELKCTAFSVSVSLSLSWIQFSLIPVANRDPPTLRAAFSCELRRIISAWKMTGLKRKSWWKDLIPFHFCLMRIPRDFLLDVNVKYRC